MLMNPDFLLQTPKSFILNRRSHRVSGWMELDHELLEDLFVLRDPEGEMILEAVVPGTDKSVVYKNSYSGKYMELSNGLRLPADYSEEEYARICRIICLVYGITPCEMNIIYGEPADVPEQPSEPERSIETSSEISKETVETNASDSIQQVADNIQISDSVMEVLDGSQIQVTAEYELRPFSKSEETWLRLMLDKVEEEKPSDRIQVTAYNDEHEIMLEKPDWDNIIDHLKHDSQALAAAKLMKKAGIKPPVMNFRGIKEHNKVGGEALFVWMDEGIAYLHGRQKYSRGYFYERRFKSVIMDDPRELIDCFRKMEAENE